MTQLTKFLIILAAAGALSAPVINPRQLGGEGQAAEPLISDFDNAVGYAGENALIHVSHLMGGDAQEPDEPGLNNGGGGGGSTSGGPPPPPPGGRKLRMAKRQLDKLADGVADVANAAGLTGEGDLVETNGDAIDGQLTGDAGQLGEQLGEDEETIGEDAGNLVPEKLPNAPATGGAPGVPGV
ncbi:uncharacterized protein B0J16DRAFT_388452 [Fusarium flagelliforme]|uniref:Uncharacterized protein n=1 Tax=Fusarium flagelliforme TaxID=2675880 RepID=A0A395MKC1_9HYPO|nr:uncharacterized protein B0J16DRAFT_388452 [Fusarium flagelliforme]KAH7174629.1 hypothetical protein B0J16DRAFT_388452 [Fusarium flagelliforme]RFN48334.1 hypothetical protein FIE12Z_7383 [Fusarium flagelliforme]